MDMKKNFITAISKKQAVDTGMAMVLILLILGFYLENIIFFKYALAGILLAMIWPMAYKYLAVVWLSGSKLLGNIVSRILLSLIFFIVLLPVAVIRRILGKDTLKLKQFKKNSSSVMISRNLKFQKEHVQKPY
jgi:hypothetical protein